MKKTLRALLLTALAAVSLCAFACAAELTGECGANGGNVTWHLDTESGVLTISGSGDMRDLEYSESLWGEESAHIKTVIVEEGVTSIGDFAFQNCNTENLTAVQLPESLKEIGKRAFGKCGALTQINFPKKLKVIDRYAFSGCSALPSAILPDSVTVLGSGAFESCWALTEVKLPAWLGTIEYGLFDGCMELRSIVIPHQVTKIDACAFQNCKKLNTIYLPKSLTTIAVMAFERTQSLRTIYYAGTAEEWKNVEVVAPSDTFSWAKVICGWVDDTPVAPPETLSGECGAEGGNVLWSLEDGVLTLSGTGAIADYSEMGNPWYGYRGMVTELVIEEGITEVGVCSFDGLDSMATVTLPRSLEKLNRYSFRGSGITHVTLPGGMKDLGLGAAFEDCVKLESVKIPANIDYLPDAMFRGCTALKEVEMPGIKNMGNVVFSGCTSLTEITIPEGMQVIRQGAFSECGLKKVTIPQSVREIEPWAFQNCAALETLELKSGDTLVGVSAFENCTALKELVLPDGAQLRKRSFMGCSALERVECLGTVRFKDAVYKDDCESVFADCTSLKEVIFSSQQTELCTGIFAGCTALETVVLPEALENVPAYAFNDCAALKEIEIPDGATQIKYNAFDGCTSLVKVTIPGSVAYIEKQAFRNCAALADISLPAGLREISYGCFTGCTSLTDIEIPGGVAAIGDEAFWNCAGLKEVMLPDAVQTIGGGAFANCTSLTAVRIPAAVTELARNTFASTALQTIYYGGTAEQWAAVDASQAGLPAGVQTQFGHRWESSVQAATSGKCGVGVEWNFDGESGVLTISGNGAMTDYATPDAAPWNVWGERVKTVVVEQGVTAIGNYAFGSCRDALEVVEIGNSVERIGSYAFAYCKKITEFYMPDSVTELGECLLIGCEGLETARVGKGMKLLQSSMFQGCTSLTGVEIPESVEVIGHGVFLDCASLKELKLPAAVRWFGFEAFGGGIGLEKIYYGGTAEQWENIEQYWIAGEGTGNEILGYIEIVYGWKSEAEELPTVSGQLSGGVSGATVEINGTKVQVNQDGSFAIAAAEGTFDVAVKVPGALTYTVKNVTANGGNITLPQIAPVKGDTNGDDMINIMDMAAFRQNFGKMGAAVQNPHTDTNGDGMVNIMDMGIFRQNFGKTAAKDCTVIYGA